MKRIIYLTAIIAIILTSCANQKTVRYTIASQMGDCIGEGPMECMLVKKGDATNWQFFYSSIEGFNYQQGYEYVLDVKEEAAQNAPADASSIKYIMAKEVSKIKKQSDGLQPLVAPALQGYQCVGKVKAISTADIGRGAAAGKFIATVVQVEVTSSVNEDVKEGDIIYCELIAEPRVKPVEGREYVFKAKHKHPAHAKGMYLLETNVMDLTR